MKSEKTKIDLIFRFRHCLAFITTLVFLLIYGSVSYASTYELSDMTLYEYYGIDSPVFITRDNIVSQLSDPSKLSSNLFPSSGSILQESLFDGTGTKCFKFLSSYNGDTIDFSNCKHLFVLGSNLATSYMIVEGSSPVYVSCYGDSIRTYSFDSYDLYEVNSFSDGSYTVAKYTPSVWNMAWGDAYIQNVNSNDILITDCPLNISTSDSSSGFSSFNDYNLNNADTYINFNYLVDDGLIVPDAPNQVNDDSVLPYASMGLNYVFGTVEPKFGTPDDMGIFATYDFKLNTYMLTHPEEYTFVMNHKFVFNTNYGDKSFYYNRELTIADILYHNDQEFNIMLDYGSFVSNDNMNMKEFLLGFYTFNGNSSSSYTDGSVISYGAGNAGQTRTFGGFTAGVREQYSNHVSLCKFYYECYFVWHGEPETTSGKLKGWKDLLSNNNRTTQNDIGTNYYPPSESDIANYPETPSNGNTTNNGGVFNDGDVIIMNGSQPWTPYTLDQVSYGNVKDMFDDIKDFVDSSSSNSFWSVLTNVLKPTSFGGYIPDKIWEYITISVAVICGFAVVRYVLRR